MQSLVSIITPSFNSEKYISETINSVKNQTYQNWEMIIVDDCSTDETVAIVKEIASLDNRIKLYENDKNNGAGFSRNKALEFVTGNYIAFLDADDLWKPEKLSKQIDFMTKNNLNFTFSFYEQIDENGKSLNKLIKGPAPLTYKLYFFCNFIGNLTGIYNKDFFGKIPIYNSRKRQDWMMWLSILKQTRTAYPVTESLAYYRVRKNSISSSKINLVKHNYLVYKEFHKLNSIKSTLSMVVFLFMQIIIKPFYTKNL